MLLYDKATIDFNNFSQSLHITFDISVTSILLRKQLVSTSSQPRLSTHTIAVHLHLVVRSTAAIY